VPEDNERWVPTSKEVTGNKPAEIDEESDTVPTRRERILARFGVRRGAGERRTEVSAPKPSPEPTPDVDLSAPAAVPEAPDEPSVQTSATELPDSIAQTDRETPKAAPTAAKPKKRPPPSGGFGVTRVDDHETVEPVPTGQPRWWPSNPNVAKQIEAAQEKGHVFSKVEVERSGTRTWPCTKCKRSVQLVVEKTDGWVGADTTAIKASAAAWACSGGR
jgi:hypothetical protein